ncbi:hypothetical protein ACPA9J_16860 [Pseudomonas aeruginosa]
MFGGTAGLPGFSLYINDFNRFGRTYKVTARWPMRRTACRPRSHRAPAGTQCRRGRC